MARIPTADEDRARTVAHAIVLMLAQLDQQMTAAGHGPLKPADELEGLLQAVCAVFAQSLHHGRVAPGKEKPLRERLVGRLAELLGAYPLGDELESLRRH